ncbi:MAG: hypothetical protein ACLUW8_00585 [Subdoligranulum sp.]
MRHYDHRVSWTADRNPERPPTRTTPFVRAARVSNVNPTIGNEFLAKSVVAVVAACVLILLYVAVRIPPASAAWSAAPPRSSRFCMTC